MNKHRTFLFNLLCLLMAGSTSLFAADTPDFAPTGEAEDFTYLTCEYYNSGRWTSGDCRIVVCEGEYLKLSTLPNYYVPTWTGPNGFTCTGDVNLGYVSASQAGEYKARYQTSSGHVLHTTITVDVLTEPTLTIEETHETCHGWDGALDLTVSDLPSGVFFELYEGHCSYLPEYFNTNYRDQSGISTTGFDISLAGLNNYFTMRFSATLTVPTTGNYTFYTNSDDGSKLYIDGNRIVNNDGYHGPRERSGNVHLTAGQHQIVVSYFEASGGELLQVKYRGPGISKRQIPTSALTVPYAVHWSNGACTEDLTGIDDGNYSVWVKYGGYNCTADAHATVNPGWDYLTNPGHITSGNYVDCVDDGQTAVDPPVFETTAATCRWGKDALYQWQEKTSMSGVWADIPGATDQDYDPEPRGAGSSWYRRLAKCDCASGYASNASTNVRDIHIKPPPTILCEFNTGNGWYVDNTCNVEVCEGGSIKFSLPGCDNNLRINVTGPNGYDKTLVGGCHNFVIANNDATASLTGTYTATVTQINTGCSSTKEFTVTVNPDPAIACEFNTGDGWYVDDSCEVEVCEGGSVKFSLPGCDNDLSISVSGPNGYHKTRVGGCHNFVISNNNATPGMSGIYTATVTQISTGCVSTQQFTVTVKPAPKAIINASVTAICSEESVTFNAGASSAGAKYAWDFGEYAIDRFRSGAGPHEVTFVLPDDRNGNDWTKAMLTVTNNGCEDVARKTIDIRDLPEVTNVESTSPVCGGANGSITVFFVDNPNRSHISFSLNGAAGPFTTVRDNTGSLTFDDLSEGDYDLFVKWGNRQCGTDLDDVILTDQPGPEVIASGGKVICTGGSVTLTASTSGGTAPLTITWMPGGETGKSITVTPDETTTYTATVTDANGCTASDDVTVETITDNLTDAGHITTGNFFECAEDSEAVDPPTFEATPATCSDDSPAIYQWQEKTSMSGVWTDIPGATDKDYDPEPREISSSWYRRQAKCDCDSDFASSNVRDIHIKELPEVTVESSDPACEGNNGSITVFFVDNPARTHISFSLNGAAGPFTTVPDSDGSLTFGDLGEGDYDLFVKWGNGQCGTDLDDVTLTAQPGPEVTAPDAEIICEGESVTLTATASGGTAPLSFMWMPGGETTASITVSPDATTTYTVKVTDANGCMDTDESIVTVNDTPDFDVTKVDATCDEDNGSATASGDAGLTYEWSNGETTATITGLSAGSYTVTATSPAGCTDTKTVVIGTTSGADVDIVCDDSEVTVRDVSMVADCGRPIMNGFFASNSTLAATPYFDIINGKFTENLSDGTATFTAAVVNQDDFSVVFDLVVNYSGRTDIPVEGSPKENTLCIGDIDNSDWYYYPVFTGQLIGTGGVAGAVVDITRVGEPFQLGTGANLYDENSLGASSWLRFDIVSQPNDPTRQLSNGRGDININVSDAYPTTPDCLNICAGESSVLTATASGAPAFDYLWSTGEMTESITVSPAVTTVYSVTITDDNGCEATDEVEVVVNDLPTFSLSHTDASCGDRNGSASVVGASSPDLTYLWSNGETTSSINGVKGGGYGVTVTSPSGCSSEGYVVILTTPKVRARIKCDNSELVARDVSMVGDCRGPFMNGFFASNGSLAPTPLFDVVNGKFTENPADGTAIFTAKVVNQSDSGVSFDIEVNFSGRTSTPPVGSPKEETLCIGDIDNSDWYYYPDFTGQLIGLEDVVGAVVDISRVGESFQIGTGANLFDASTFGASGWIRFDIVSQPDDATIVLRNDRGDINVNLSGDANTPPVVADCFNIVAGESSVLTAFSPTGTPEFSFDWSTGETTATITVSPLMTTTYTVTITDANGCSQSASVTVHVTDPGSARTAVTITETSAEGVTAGDIAGTETAAAAEVKDAKRSAPAPTAPVVALNDGEFVFDLAQNAPNPFSDETVIRFTLPEAGNATLVVIDLAGRQVREIRQDFAAGQNQVQLNGNDLAAGTYVYTLMFNGQRLTRRMIHMPR